MLTPVAPLHVVDVLAPERSAFVEFLRSLEPDDWSRRTECPAYTVQGVATHILGDDLSLLSRQRDSAAPSLLPFAEQGLGFPESLHAFNDSWVDVAQFLSPALLIDLLTIVGVWTSDWYSAVDPMARGEVVGYFGSTEPSPYWQISAREYAERWIHHQQLRRAVGAADLVQPSLYLRAIDAVMLATISRLGSLRIPLDTSMTIEIIGVRSWTATRQGAGWELSVGSDGAAEMHVDIAPDAAPRVLSQGCTEPDLKEFVTVRGPEEVADRFYALLVR